MRANYTNYLIDPKTGEDLILESILEEKGRVLEGFLVSRSNRYPIIRGIPRFAGYKDDLNYTKSFGYQWNKWSQIQFDSKNIGKPMQGYTLKMWDRITGVETGNLKSSVIVDFGCGPGRFIETIREKGGLAIGLDLSDAVEAAGEIFKDDPDVLVCQADILKSPIKSGSVDGVFSIGVLHHTTGPYQGFLEMVKVLKPSGWISVSVYSPGGYYDSFFVHVYRKIFKTLWPIFGHYPPLIYSYFTIYILRPILKIPILRTLIRPFFTFFPFVNLPDIRWSILDTFDGVTPSNQSGHTPYEVFHWFKSAGLRDIEPSDWAGASYHAKK